MNTRTRLLINAVLVLAAGAAGYHLQAWRSAPPETVASVTPNVDGTGEAGTGEAGAVEATDDPKIASINGMAVHKSELVPYLQDVASTEELLRWGRIESVPMDVYEAALRNLAQDRLVRRLADEAAITEQADVRALMTKSTNRIAKLAYLDRLSAALVDDAAIRQRYDELASSLKGKQEYRARHILLRDEKEARTIVQALDKRPFEELAKLFSLDEGTGLHGGDLGYFLPGTLDPEFEAVVTRLEVGAMAGPFKTRFGWHIAILDDVRDAAPMPFEQAQPIIRGQLERAATQAWLDDLVAKAEIKPFLLERPAPDQVSSN